MTAAVPVIVGYVIGSIPFALLLARRIGGVDLRSSGSGNVGAANVLRTTGLAGALAAVALDISKGAGAIVVARGLTADPAAVATAGVAAILGHVYPAWIGFRGGKGVATSCGVFAILAPEAALASLAVFVLTVWYTRYVSLGSVVASVALPLAVYFSRASAPVVAGAIAAAALVIERHRSNLARLQAGTEHRFGQRI